MRAGHAAVLALGGLALAACMSQPGPPRPAPPVQPAIVAPAAPARPKPPLPRFECSFRDGDAVVYRTYVIQPRALIDEGPPRLRFKIVSDDGETIIASHKARGAKTPTVVTIGLRRHEASLSPGKAGAGPVPPLPGTCAQSG